MPSGAGMEHESFLQTIAQVGATFGGLAAVIAAFRNASETSRGAFVIRDVVEISIMVTIASLVPYVVYQSGLSAEVSWRACCVVLLFFVALGGGASLLRGSEAWRAMPLIRALVSLAAVLIFSALGLSSIGAYFVPADVTYLMVLVLLLLVAGILFLSILLPSQTAEK